MVCLQGLPPPRQQRLSMGPTQHFLGPRWLGFQHAGPLILLLVKQRSLAVRRAPRKSTRPPAAPGQLDLGGACLQDLQCVLSTCVGGGNDSPESLWNLH